MVTSCVFTVEGAGGRDDDEDDVDEEVEPEDEPDCADDEESNWLVTMEGASSR
jgi:hypothetical protein